MSNIVNNINTIVMFLPRVLVLCFFVSCVRSSKCVTHTTFVVSGLVRGVKLRNGSFVPLVVKFNYGMPTIVTAEAVRDRHSHLVAVLVLPLVDYSTHLPVCVVIVKAFFTVRCHSLVVMSLCLVNVFLTIVLDHVFTDFIIGNRSAPFIVRLPPCHFPA